MFSGCFSVLFIGPNAGGQVVGDLSFLKTVLCFNNFAISDHSFEEWVGPVLDSGGLYGFLLNMPILGLQKQRQQISPVSKLRESLQHSQSPVMSGMIIICIMIHTHTAITNIQAFITCDIKKL